MKVIKTVVAMILLLALACFSNKIEAQTINISSPKNGMAFLPSEPINISAVISNPSYLKITNTQTGYRKLKVGYSPVNLYSPMNNVTVGGNNMMEITLCNFGAVVDWTKIQIRPQGNLATPVKLAGYVNSAGGIGNSWKTIFIPLADFDPAINFSQISLIEVPYSASAGAMDIGISRIAFTGGLTPFLWFGEGHTDNLHNGNGGSGELVAQLVTPAQGSVSASHVDFYNGNNLLRSVSVEPYAFIWAGGLPGNYDLTAKAGFANGNSIVSAPVRINVISQAVSRLSVEIVNPVPSISYNSLSDILISSVVKGVLQPEPAWIKVSNNQTSYRKLKIGYNPANLYGPLQNVTAGGNTMLEITLKDISGITNWSKIQIRPQGNTSAPVTLAPYVASAGGIGSEWKTIYIPLSAFDPSINLSQISLIEFPYSQNAGNFDLGIQKIQFTGGTAPFVWFGGTKSEVSQNGNGGSGELTASIIPASLSGPSVNRIDFYIDQILSYSDSIAPYEYNWTNAISGEHSIHAKLTDSETLTSLSSPIPIQVVDANPNLITLKVVFDLPPAQLDIKKASLRYNKAFAYSFTLDDGLIDAYTIAFPLLLGGTVAGNGIKYPGYFYSDGCGNAIPFSAGLSWYSVNSIGSDLHVNTPGYVSWGQLLLLYNSGWNVFNHSYSHAAYGTTDYVSQITLNTDYVKAKSGIDLTHFVVPSGDQNYLVPAFANGMLTASGNNGAFRGGPNGYRIDQPIDFSNMKLFKMLVCDANQDTSNVMAKINIAASSSVNGQHYWWSDFTHNVGFKSTGASLLFPLFQYYMQNVAQKYGLAGADNMWMAPIQDVYEYLIVRDKALIDYSLSGNTLTITIDNTAVPKNLRTQALTLAIQSDQNFSDVTASGSNKFTYNGAGSTKLINLQWGKSTLKSGLVKAAESSVTGVEKANKKVSVWPNPFFNTMTVRLSEPPVGKTELILIDLSGKIVYHRIVYPGKGESQFELNLQGINLLSGIYFLKTVNASSNIPAAKVVKL